MASKKKERQEGRKNRKQEREQNRKRRQLEKEAKGERRTNRREALRDRRAERRMRIRENKFTYGLMGLHKQRMEERTRRVEIRNDRWKSNVASRTERHLARSHAKEVAYENGIDPDAWKSKLSEGAMEAVGKLGQSAIETFGGKGKKGIGDMVGDALDNVELDADGNPITSGGNKKNIIIAAVVGGIVLIIGLVSLVFKKKKKR